jgi:large subunit ribosomal protein L1
MDKFANMHTSIGKLSFSDDQLFENGAKLVQSVLQAKPKSLKGTYIKGAYLSSTMGPGIKLDLSKFMKELETAE